MEDEAKTTSKSTPEHKPRLRHSRHVRAGVIKEFRRTGRVDLACAAAGCDRDSHYLWLKKFPKYAEEFEAARTQVAGLLEDEAIRRAYHGTIKPVSIGGKQVLITEFSDRLLERLLEARNPLVFGRNLTLQGPGGKPLFDAAALRDYIKSAPDGD